MTATETPPLPARPLGPGSLAWYATSDSRGGVLAVRSLMMQVAHPMVGAGVAAHSVYKTDPYGRLWRSVQSLLTQVFGGYQAAEEGARLIAMHTDIKGTDSAGRRYHALNPEAYLWVHATLFEAWRMFLRDLGPGLNQAEEAQLFDEWRRVGLLIGCKERIMPQTVAEYDAYFADMVANTLENNEVVQDLLFYGPKRPPFVPIPQRLFDFMNAPLLRLQRSLAAETLPDELVARFGLKRDRTTARHWRLIRRIAKVTGLLPDVVRRTPLAQWNMWRTSRDPRIVPEPIQYPSKNRLTRSAA